MNSFYCINAVPFSICIILSQFKKDDAIYTGSVNIASVIATYLNLLNHAASIIVNCWNNKIFRRQLYEMVFKRLKFLKGKIGNVKDVDISRRTETQSQIE
jgi:hypothetical protein